MTIPQNIHSKEPQARNMDCVNSKPKKHLNDYRNARRVAQENWLTTNDPKTNDTCVDTHNAGLRVQKDREERTARQGSETCL
jgi:hypothetical protein